MEGFSLFPPLRAYWTGLAWGGRSPKELSPEAFRPPSLGEGFLRGIKPKGGLWLSFWVEGYGPEWGIPWLLASFGGGGESIEAVLRSPVWEVNLEGLRLKLLGAEPPDWREVLKRWDGAVAPYHRLKASRPYRPSDWWRFYDVDTVWLARFPEAWRLRPLGTLGELASPEAKEALRRALEGREG